MPNKKTKKGRPILRAVGNDRPPFPPEPVSVSIPVELVSAVEALIRIQRGEGAKTDLAEIALAVHSTETVWHRAWFLEIVPEAIRDVTDLMHEAARHNRWGETNALKDRRMGLFDRLRVVLERYSPPPPPRDFGA